MNFQRAKLNVQGPHAWEFTEYRHNNQLKGKLAIMFDKIGRKRLTYRLFYTVKSEKSIVSLSISFLLCCVQLFQDLNFMNFDLLEK